MTENSAVSSPSPGIFPSGGGPKPRIRHLAEHDELTGLLNRRGLLSRARRTLAMARQLEEHATVLFIDLDNFKLVNDGYGHRIGDLALVASGSKA